MSHTSWTSSSPGKEMVWSQVPRGSAIVLLLARVPEPGQVGAILATWAGCDLAAMASRLLIEETCSTLRTTGELVVVGDPGQGTEVYRHWLPQACAWINCPHDEAGLAALLATRPAGRKEPLVLVLQPRGPDTVEQVGEALRRLDGENLDMVSQHSSTHRLILLAMRGSLSDSEVTQLLHQEMASPSVLGSQPSWARRAALPPLPDVETPGYWRSLARSVELQGPNKDPQALSPIEGLACDFSQLGVLGCGK